MKMPVNFGGVGDWALACSRCVTLLFWAGRCTAGSMPEEIARTFAQLQAQIAERDHERAKAQAFLDMTANRSTRDQSQFLNGLIQRKSFSWTRVFEDLERVMPANLHVVSLRPEPNDQNQMQLDMKVVGDTRSRRWIWFTGWKARGISSRRN